MEWNRLRVFIAALGHGLALAVKAAVRCAFPLLCLAVFAAFVWAVPQGRDLLAGLMERVADPENGHSVAGLLWLAGACAALGLSLWYSMRWLLGTEFPGLPLPPPGVFGRWVPRLMAAAPAALVASGAWTLSPGASRGAGLVAPAFAALALLLLAAVTSRGRLMQALEDRGYLSSAGGRVHDGRGLRPGLLAEGLPMPEVTVAVVGWSLALSFLLFIAIALFPVGVPQDIGAAAIAGLALASINLFGSFVLSWWPLRRGLPPLAPWALLLAGVLGWTNDNHRVRASEFATDSRAPRVDLAQRFREHVARQPGPVPPVIFVASEGGGIRAAYWTSAVLSALETQPGLEDWPARTFALSGVSGGSLGLASWLARHRSLHCATARAQPPGGVRLGAGPPQPAHLLGADFLSPPVAGLLNYDLVQRFWPAPIEAFDRSRALEASWQRTHAQLPGRPFERTLAQWYAGCEALPELLLNATAVETGQRAVLSRLSGEAFVNALSIGGQDAMGDGFSADTQSVAGLVHHSARFPALSPAGTIDREIPGPDGLRREPAFRLVDGGYFDNSGAQTVLDLVQHLCDRGPAFRPVVLLVRNAPEPLESQNQPGDVRPSGLFPEAGSIVMALYNARSAHAVNARLALKSRLGDDLIDVVVPPDSQAADADPPLGWTLSRAVQRAYDATASEVAGTLAGSLRQRLQAAGPGCTRAPDGAGRAP